MKILKYALCVLLGVLLTSAVQTKDAVTRIEGWLQVDGIIVGSNALDNDDPRILILPDRILLSGADGNQETTTTNLITADRMDITNPNVQAMIGIGEKTAVAVFHNKARKEAVGIQLTPTPRLVINSGGQVRTVK